MPKPYSDPARKAWPFFALFVLVGIGLLTPFVLQGIRDYRIAKVYQPTEAEIMDERQVTSESSSRLGGTWVTNHYSHKEFTWSYRVKNRHYVAEGYDNHDGIMAEGQEMGNIAKGMKHECWYDPANPEKSVLVRKFRAKFYLGALIPGSFILIAGSMLVGTLRRKPMKTVVYVSEGERLPHRLSPVISTRGVIGCLGIAIVVLGLFILLVLPKINVGDVSPSLIGGKGWLYLICLGIEGFLVYHVWTKGRAAMVPDPLVELANEPLMPGQKTQLFIRQSGPASLALFEVQIVCETLGEKGIRVAYKHQIVQRGSMDIGSAEEFSETFSVPANAKPSAKTVQTAVTWNIRIRRKLTNGSSYDTDYSFRVVKKEAGEVVEEP